MILRDALVGYGEQRGRSSRAILQTAVGDLGDQRASPANACCSADSRSSAAGGSEPFWTAASASSQRAIVAPSYRGAASKQNDGDRRSARPVWGGGNETAKTWAGMRRGNDWVRAGLFDIVNMPQRRPDQPVFRARR